MRSDPVSIFVFLVLIAGLVEALTMADLQRKPISIEPDPVSFIRTVGTVGDRKIVPRRFSTSHKFLIDDAGKAFRISGIPEPPRSSSVYGHRLSYNHVPSVAASNDVLGFSS
ncbi:unnamed protein product [Caenorhabditis auriculariae]|uniref:Uncharacterized protein n=1 Tax=Caenorhabditis auriculariae TaxID=2777116 RepID=A0A8S1HPT3_9PELO|nr:unnamed protein product [Caenorhabditis auriculariae]